MRLTESWVFQVLEKCCGSGYVLNLNADLLYNNCLSHHFSEFE